MIIVSFYFSFVILDKLLFNNSDILPILKNGRLAFENGFSIGTTIFGPVFFAAYFLGSDFINGTLQNSITQGHSRFNIVMTKALVYSNFSAFIMLLTPITTTLVVSYINGWGAEINFEYCLRVVILTFLINNASVSIYFLFSFLCRDIIKTLIVAIIFTVLFIELGSLWMSQSVLFHYIYQHFPFNLIAIAVKPDLSSYDLFQILFSVFTTWVVCIGTTFVLFNKKDLD